MKHTKKIFLHRLNLSSAFFSLSPLFNAQEGKKRDNACDERNWAAAGFSNVFFNDGKKFGNESRYMCNIQKSTELLFSLSMQKGTCLKRKKSQKKIMLKNLTHKNLPSWDYELHFKSPAAFFVFPTSCLESKSRP